MNTEHRQQKISFWHSMKTQFIAVVILVAAVIVILYTLMIMPGVKSNIRSIYSDYLLDLSISYGREMESAMQVNIDLLDNPEAAQDILQQLDTQEPRQLMPIWSDLTERCCIILPLRKSGSR